MILLSLSALIIKHKLENNKIINLFNLFFYCFATEHMSEAHAEVVLSVFLFYLSFSYFLVSLSSAFIMTVFKVVNLGGNVILLDKDDLPGRRLKEN